MENNQSDLAYENQRLEQAVTLAESQLDKAKRANENNKEAILAAKKEMRENTQHSLSNLWSNESFESLVAMAQYTSQINYKIESFEATQSKITSLENSIKSPYFARIDFKFDGENEPEKIYIGRTSLMKDNSYEIFVYDWRSPIAGVFYRFVPGRAFYDAPDGKIEGEVSLKRQYEIKNSKLDYFFDADIEIIDEFLRKLLSQNTSSKMKAIVETIQKEQDIIIRDIENDLMMVQGVAGSGKTSIALHRAAYLMYQGLSSKLSANNIMIISPNTLFERYISNVLPELGENNVISVVFEDIISEILKNEHIQTKNQFLENLITSPKYSAIMKSCLEFKTSKIFIEILSRFIHDMPYKWIEFDDVFYENNCIATKDELKKKIISGRKATPLGVKLKMLEDYIFEQIAEHYNKRITKTEKFLILKEIMKFTQINIKTFYRMLFSDKEYFYSLAVGLNLPDCIEDILKFSAENLYGDNLYYDDASAMAFFSLKLNGNTDYRNIKQVVIDEAQDYYYLHYEMYNLLFSNSKYTILGDINQTLEKREDLTLYEQIPKILKKKKSTLIKMDKSFRCTNEILEYSSKFIPQNSEIKNFNRTGDIPKVYSATHASALENMIISEIKFCLEKNYNSIGLICKTEKNARALYEHFKKQIDLQLITNENTTDLSGVFIIPVYMSKGLEFDAVLICDSDDENYKSEDDKKLLYIACTRALHRLNLFCEGKTSRLL